MRIDPRLIAQSSDIAATQRKQQADAVKAPSRPAVAAASVSLSGAGEAVQKFGSAVKAGPATRAEKVAKLREAIENGSYQPAGSDIASAILERGAEQIDVDQLRGN